jgi:hypothetical protein
MRYDSLCFYYQKTPSALATTYKRLYAGTHKEHISRQQFANEQSFVVQIVLHPQLMSSSNASRLLVHPVNRQHIFLPSLFFS